MHGLTVYVKEGLPFARDLSLENSADPYLCFRPALLHSVFYFFYRSGELCYNFSISNGLIQMVNFPTRIPDSHSPVRLDLFLPSEASICSTMVFPPLGNSDHVVVSVSIDFPSNSLRNVPSHRIAYDYSRADWEALRHHLRDVPWEGILKPSASRAASEFCEWVQVGIDVDIPHRKYQVKSHSSPSP